MSDERSAPGRDEEEPREAKARRDEPAAGGDRLKDLPITDSDGTAIKGGIPKLPDTK